MITPPPFVVRRPAAPAVPLLVSIPHTGTRLPGEVAATLADDAMRAQPMTDWHLHDLYDFLPRLGATSIHAVYSRFVVDLNRPPKPKALYPGRFETGLVPLETFDGRPVFAEAPDAALVEQRRRLYHAPYHACLSTLLNDLVSRFGHAVLIDAHSVASAGNRIHGPLVPDVILGDRDGRSSDAWLGDMLDDAFTSQGYAVARNDPYKGGFITDFYGQRTDVDALQIEMAQRVYMDEQAPGEATGAPAFAETRRKLEAVFRRLVAALV